MRKSFLFVAALALVFASCQKEGEVENKTVATFEEAAISPTTAESYYTYANDTIAMLHSGMYYVQQSVSWLGSYISGAVVTNITTTDFKDYTDAYKSAAGGAYAGKNYVVWYEDGFSGNVVKLSEAAVVPGFYVCNNVYALNSMKNGDNFVGAPFTSEDFLSCTITLFDEDGAVINTQDVELAKANKADEEKYLESWKNIIFRIENVKKMTFSFKGSRNNNQGLLTPAYMCVDDIIVERSAK